MKKIFPLISSLFGIFICCMPHILHWFTLGKPIYFADSDDTSLYLTYASFAYNNHPLRLIDPIKLGFTFTPWTQLMPGAIIAKLFFIPPIYINFIWRIWAGFSIGFIVYQVFNKFIKNKYHSLAFSVIILCDCGVYSSQLFIKSLWIIKNYLINNNISAFESFPQLFLQWRIITPGISLFFVFLHIYLYYSSFQKNSNTEKKILFAGLSYGFLFYLYFYFWTAITLSLGIIICISLLYIKKDFTKNLKIFAIGILTGAPSLIFAFLDKQKSNPESLPRLDFFYKISHFSDILIPKASILLFLACSFYIFYSKKKEFLYLLSIVFSSLLLLNHQIFTGLQIQNFHYQYILGPIGCVLIMLCLYDFIQTRKINASPIILILALFTFTSGSYLRYLEVTQTAESQKYLNTYLKFSKQNDSSIWKKNKIIAGDTFFAAFALIENNVRPLSGILANLSPQVGNQEWSERIALNAFLSGNSFDEFSESQKTHALQYYWGKWGKDANERTKLYEERKSIFLSIQMNPITFLNKYDVSYIAIPYSFNTPKFISLYPSHWKVLQAGPYWNIWQKNTEK